jgi:histidine ammonia-lyase
VNCEKVQDAYTLRCIPQVYGAIMDTLDYAKGILEVEINAATDNPLIFPEEGEVISGGNFHGEPLAFAMDYLGIALSEIGNISERTLDRLINPHVSGLPPFLVKKSGINTGFMITQYTAAALVSENKVLCHPASVDSIPTSANKEDHVSMGTIAARQCREVLDNTEAVIAIELLCAAQALDLFTNLKPGEGTLEAYRVIRREIPHLDTDRILAADIAAMQALIRSGKILAAVEKKVGRLN